MIKEIPVFINETVLKRSQYEQSQTQKDKLQRSQVLNASFIPYSAETKVLEKKALLIDDVLTTGATVSSCEQIMRNMGYRDIGIVTLAISI